MQNFRNFECIPTKSLGEPSNRIFGKNWEFGPTHYSCLESLYIEGPPPFGLPPIGLLPFGLTPIGLGLPPIGLPPFGLPPIGLARF